MRDNNIMTKCQLGNFLDKVKNFESRPIVRKLKIEDILGKISNSPKHTDKRSYFCTFMS
jgi:hypothetical protein